MTDDRMKRNGGSDWGWWQWYWCSAAAGMLLELQPRPPASGGGAPAAQPRFVRREARGNRHAPDGRCEENHRKGITAGEGLPNELDDARAVEAGLH